MGLGMGMHGMGWRDYLHSSGEKPKLTRNLLRRVMGYAGPYRGRILGLFLLMMATSGLGLVTPLIMRRLIDRVIPSGDFHLLAAMSAALLAVPIAAGLLRVWQRKINAAIGEGVTYDLRTALYGHLQKMSMRFYTHTRSGELISRLNNDVLGAQNAISNTLTGFASNVIQCAAVLAVMCTLEWRLTAVSIVILPLFIAVSRRLARRLRDLSRRQMEANAAMNAAMLVKLFGRAAEETERFGRRASALAGLDVNRAVLGASFMVFIGLVSAVGTAMVYGFGGAMVMRGTLTVGTIVAFGSYLALLYASLQGLANNPVEFATSVVSFERVFEVLDMPPDIREKPDAVELRRVTGALAFEDVSFRYELRPENLLAEVRRFGRSDSPAGTLSGAEAAPYAGKEADGIPAKMDAAKTIPASQARSLALEHISFRVRPGQLAALVGPSGAGKTTVTYLIPRLYDPTAGRVTIDGIDIREATLASLTAQIGMVTQETHLFHDTIRTNLLYARPDARQTDLEEAAKAANIHDFIAGLPDRYDTVVGERGYRLSGGEKQRLALARVILKDPRILVLDEATSSLDSESESLIQEALKRLMAGRTNIVIAHRLSTILAADMILVLDRGRVVESGTHGDLLEKGGLYANLYETQFRDSQPGRG
jgi:ATP-binding cassette subfamily B protein